MRNLIYLIHVIHSLRYLHVNSTYNFTTINDSRAISSFTVIKSRELFDARIYRTYIYMSQEDRRSQRNSIQSEEEKENSSSTRGMETEIHELPVDGPYSSEYQYEYLLVTYCWHRRYAGKRSGARLLMLSSLFGTRPVLVPGVRLSFRLSICHHPLANCHFTDSLFCENRLHSDSNEASFTPCHASYTPLGTRSSSTRQMRGNGT